MGIVNFPDKTQKSRTNMGSVYKTATASGLITVLDVYGTGKINSIYLSAPNTSTVYSILKVTIDSRVIINYELAGGVSSYLDSGFNFNPSYIRGDQTSCDISFQKSALVQITSFNPPTYETSCSLVYELE